MIDTVLQVVGFVGVIVGYALYVKRPFIAALTGAIGATALAIWCMTQPIIPIGIFTVQLVVMLINLNNARLLMRVSKE